MKNYQNPFSSTLIRTLPVAVIAMLLCHITKAAIADFGDSTAWAPYIYGSGVQLNNVNGGRGFQVDYAAGTQADEKGIGAGYISTFSLRGDFVMQMDYTLNTWPSAPNGVGLVIGLVSWIGMERASNPYTGDGYAFQTPGSLTSVPTTDLSGSLMLTRAGGTLSGYYWGTPGQGWVLVNSSTGYSQDFTVNPASFVPPGTFGGQPVAVTLNNLQITVVPEPSKFALLLLPFGANILRKLRNRVQNSVTIE